MKEIRPGYWKGEIWHEGRRRGVTFAGSAAEAKAHEAKKLLELKEGKLLDHRVAPGFETFFAETYKPHAKSKLRKETWAVRRYQITNLCLFFKDTKLTKITTQLVEQYKQARRKNERAAKETVNTEVAVLSTGLAYARFLGLPCAEPKIKKFKTRRKRGHIRFWSKEDVQRLYDACARVAPNFFPMLFFLGQVGARKSEAIHLPWSNVILERGLVRIWSEVDDEDDEDGDGDEDDDNYEVKGGEREVPLSDALLRVLREQKLRGLSKEWVFPVTQGRNKGGQYGYFPKATFKLVLAATAVEAKDGKPALPALKGGPHKLRHSYASNFLAAKPDLYLLSKLLGHSSFRVTETCYAHLVPGYLDAARNVVTATVPEMDTEPRKLRRVK